MRTAFGPMAKKDSGLSSQFTALLTTGMMLTTIGMSFMALIPWMAFVFPLLGVVLIAIGLMRELASKESD